MDICIKDPADRDAIQWALKQRLHNLVAADDQAGHLQAAKESGEASGGVFTYHCNLEWWAEILETLDLVDWAPELLYHRARRFHSHLELPENPPLITLRREDWTVDQVIELPDGETLFPYGYHPDPKQRKIFRLKITD